MTIEKQKLVSRKFERTKRDTQSRFGSQVAYSKFPFFSWIYLTNDQIDKHNLKNQKPEKLLFLPIFHLPIENLAYIHIYHNLKKNFNFPIRTKKLSLSHSFIYSLIYPLTYFFLFLSLTVTHTLTHSLNCTALLPSLPKLLSISLYPTIARRSPPPFFLEALERGRDPPACSDKDPSKRSFR